MFYPTTGARILSLSMAIKFQFKVSGRDSLYKKLNYIKVQLELEQSKVLSINANTYFLGLQ